MGGERKGGRERRAVRKGQVVLGPGVLYNYELSNHLGAHLTPLDLVVSMEKLSSRFVDIWCFFG